jgi:hypothetical protein
MLAIEAGGIAALIVGAVLVARSSAFGGLRKITDAITPHSATPEASPGRSEGETQPAPHRTRRRLSHGPASGEEGG